MISRLFFLLLIILPLFSTEAFALKITDFYRDVNPGQWILMRSSDGLKTRTTILEKEQGKLVMRIESFIGEDNLSVSKQVFDLQKSRIISIRTIDETGRVFELSPENSDVEDFFGLEFAYESVEKVHVPAGTFLCRVYRAIYQDYVVKIWINDDVPILHLVKISSQGIVVRLEDYGAGEGKEAEKQGGRD